MVLFLEVLQTPRLGGVFIFYAFASERTTASLTAVLQSEINDASVHEVNLSL